MNNDVWSRLPIVAETFNEQKRLAMHITLFSSALDAPIPNRRGRAFLIARHGARLLGMVAQSLAFFALLWLLLAAPGFLSARDSVAADRPAQASPAQASR